MLSNPIQISFSFKLCYIFSLQPSFLHTDFSRWRDEDDSEEEDTGIDDNFEAVSAAVLK